ncbi:MAG: hypothetical protein HN404_00735 [Gemmatimonadetes bacterium]|jgi:hypothetical protein|nr:hypothetical protein [Gemmatimonadota bacterium]
MGTESSTETCFNCTAPETRSPLISLRFAGQPIWICPQCMPVLIHDTAKLAEKLSQMTDGSSQ